MAHRQTGPARPTVTLAPLPDADDLDSATPLPVDLGANLTHVVRRAKGERRRFIVRDDGDEVAAIIPLADLHLLLRLEEEELDRIDLKEARRALADPDNGPPIPWEPVTREATP